MNQLRENILAINPGSTSTKIAVFGPIDLIFEETIRHSPDELAAFSSVMEQYAFRKDLITRQMEAHAVAPGTLRCIVGRGGLVKPILGGTYAVSEALLADLRAGVGGEHPCNLGGLIAHAIAQELCIPAFIVDPPVVDEIRDIARLSGVAQLPRVSRFHTLNHRAAGHKAAARLGRSYAQCNFVIAHMGGGISVTAHEQGLAVDTNNGVDSEGSYTPERGGTLPVGALIDLCYSGKYTQRQTYENIVHKAGLMGYLGTNDAREVMRRIQDGDEYARMVYEGMGYQIAKEIGAYATVLKGKVDAICLTGGLAHEPYLMQYITDMVCYIAPVMVFPGEDELRALYEGAMRVLEGSEQAKVYA